LEFPDFAHQILNKKGESDKMAGLKYKCDASVTVKMVSFYTLVMSEKKRHNVKLYKKYLTLAK
jgi:predicted protein tyrosine phosphatase